MNSEAMEKALTTATRKAELLNNGFMRYCLSSIQAGAYLTIVGLVFWAIRQNFGADPAGKILSSLFFGVGLSIIVFTATELFTSNNFYMTLSTLEGRTKISETLWLWTVCWVGNFAGAIIVALLLLGAGVIGNIAPDHALLEGARHKMELSSSEIFFKGILANWIVCLAVWVNLQMKDDMARVFAIILIVFIFLYLGFEHSIANMGLFSISYLADSNLSLSAMAHNLFWATLGNILGGGLGLGFVVWMMKEK